MIFHLAAVVSGEAETDLEKGYRVNLDGTRALFDAVRAAHTLGGYRPRLVFTSSIAVYGAPLPDPIPEDFHETPLTSYGTRKRSESSCSPTTPVAESSTASIRLPTICIRPGKPNKAASASFRASCGSRWSGRRRSCRFRRRSGTGTRRPAQQWSSWSGRPRSMVRRSASTDVVHARPQRHRGADRRARRVAGEQAVRLIRREPDESIMRMVETWAPALEATRRCAWASPQRVLSMRSSGCTSRMSLAALSKPATPRTSKRQLSRPPMAECVADLRTASGPTIGHTPPEHQFVGVFELTSMASTSKSRHALRRRACVVSVSRRPSRRQP